MCRAVVLVVVAACGRIGFDDIRDGAVTSGLVVRYPMDDDPSGGTVTASVAALDAPCNPCPQPIAGHIASAYMFDGTQRIQIPSSTLVGLAPYTVAVWVIANPVSDDVSIVSKALTNGSDRNVFNLYVELDTGSVVYETTDGQSFIYTRGSVDVRGTAWHHAAASWDGTHTRIYVDGVLQDTGPTPPVDSALQLTIGVDTDLGLPHSPYVGAMDELEFYDRALDNAEIAALAAQ